MKIKKTKFNDCFIIKPTIFEDQRGYFFESFNKNIFRKKTGVSVDFIQDNESKSSKNVLRGLHFQKGEYAQAKLVRVLQGSVLDVCVDLRKESPTFGEHLSIILKAEEQNQLFVPRGLAHGFLALEENTILSYKCDNYYNKASEDGIYFADPTLNIDWKLNPDQLILSEKDKKLPSFKRWMG